MNQKDIFESVMKVVIAFKGKHPIR